MTTTIRNTTIGWAAMLALMPQAAPGASFIMLNDPSLSTGFEQRWNQTAVWQYVDGVDDGTAGIPDGADTFTIDRNTGGFPADNTDLSNEGMPIHSIAAITATGAPGRDMILKYTADPVTIGDLTLLASASVFHIEEERVQSLIINGVISGAGDLLLSRAAGFSPGGTEPDDLITITGSSPNTITGSIRLLNTNNGGYASYFVADKVGAFGQAPTVTLEGVSGGGVTSLQFTANTLGGEGAIDDDATELYIGRNGLLSVDAGVNEAIGIGNLFIDLAGTGTYTEVAPGTYNSSEDWIIGDGTVSVGAPATGPRITSITGVGGGVWELTLEGKENSSYEFRSSAILDFNPGILVENLTAGGTPVGTIGGSNDSVLTTDSNGDGTVRMALTGPMNFVRAQIPPPLLSENFESGQGGWVTAFTGDAGTTWALGGPGSPGPASASSLSNCFGTNLTANYTDNANATLTSPPLAVPSSGASLTFRYWIDTDLIGDLGILKVLNADAGDAELATIKNDFAGEGGIWKEYPATVLPAAANGKNIKLQFQFISDSNGQVWSGWYIDDVEVTAN